MIPPPPPAMKRTAAADVHELLAPLGNDLVQVLVGDGRQDRLLTGGERGEEKGEGGRGKGGRGGSREDGGTLRARSGAKRELHAKRSIGATPAARGASRARGGRGWGDGGARAASAQTHRNVLVGDRDAGVVRGGLDLISRSRLAAQLAEQVQSELLHSGSVGGWERVL